MTSCQCGSPRNRRAGVRFSQSCDWSRDLNDIALKLEFVMLGLLTKKGSETTRTQFANILLISPRRQNGVKHRSQTRVKSSYRKAHQKLVRKALEVIKTHHSLTSWNRRSEIEVHFISLHWSTFTTITRLFLHHRASFNTCNLSCIKQTKIKLKC